MNMTSRILLFSLYADHLRYKIKPFTDLIAFYIKFTKPKMNKVQNDSSSGLTVGHQTPSVCAVNAVYCLKYREYKFKITSRILK